jgi:uncharacterized protein
MKSPTAQELIHLHGLLRHPEGGHFRETYRSEALAGALPDARNFSTAIYFLLEAGEKSALHRIKSDELWHFYLGGPLVLAELAPGAPARLTLLGTDFRAGQKLQHTVTAGTWFGAYPAAGTEFSFVGCTVSPGFDYEDFELAERTELLAQFPQAREIIEELAPERGPRDPGL